MCPMLALSEMEGAAMTPDRDRLALAAAFVAGALAAMLAATVTLGVRADRRGDWQRWKDGR